MHHLTEYTNSINLIRVKAKWCHNLRFKDKVNRQKKVVNGNIPILLKQPKDLWVIKVIPKKSKDHLKQICFKFTKEDNLLKIKQCSRITKLSKGHHYKISGIVSKIWTQIVISTKFLLKNLQSRRTKAYKGLLLRLRNSQLDLVLVLNRIQIKLNPIRL